MKTSIKTRCSGISAGLLWPIVVVMAGLGRPWAAGVQTGNGCNSNDPGAPCFANVSDILQGRRRLLPVDDLVVTSQPGGTGNAVNNVVLQTTDSSIGNQLPYPILSNPNAFATGVGRMFNLPRDVIFTMTGPPGGINVRNQDPNGPITQGFPFPRLPQAMTMADFNGDGFADVAVLAADAPGSTSGLLQIITANDVNSLGAGLFVSDGVGPQFINFNLDLSIAAGDFNGDGKAEVAIAQPAPLNGGEILVYLFEVLTNQNGTIANPALRQVASLTFPVNGVAEVALTAGDYDGVTNSTGLPEDELVIAYRFGNNLALSSIDVDSTNPNAYQLVFKGNTLLSTRLTTASNVIAGLASGRLNWFGATDQVVAAFNSPDSQSQGFVNIYTFDSQLNFQLSQEVSQLPLTAMALGNYAQVLGQNDPPNLEIALLMPDFLPFPGSFQLSINRVDPSNNFAISQVSQTQILPGLSPYGNNTLLLVAGDTQGRSLLLGPPEKVSVTAHFQPDTILGLPPMHVDWITPDGSSPPAVLNVSVFPANFNAQYNFQNTSGTQASRMNTTSYTVAFKESAEEKISYGVPDIDSVSVTLKQAATQTHQNTVSKTYNTYKGESFSLTAQTVFDDLVAATEDQFNIYSYPVIGQCVAVNDAPALDGCLAGTAPLHVQFSGPDNVVYSDPVEGATIEWYQPVHEPGNVLSYPGSLCLLHANQCSPPPPPLQLLSPDNVVWEPTANEHFSVNWTQGGGSNVTSGSVSTHTFDTSVSSSGSASIEGFGLSGSASFDYNQSQSVSTLNTSASTYSESTGVTINRGTPDNGGSYLYQAQSFIFGQTAPTGTIQSDLSINTTVQAQGFLAVGYASDPLSLGTIQSSNWWKQAYTAAPDVALNHPQRWFQNEPSGTNTQQVWFNCPIGFTSSPTSPHCTLSTPPVTPTPTNVAHAFFYRMKGLFVTPCTVTPCTPGGPQITLATQGQTVTLQARVYNYSLANMPAGTTVHVRFYAQPWDANHGKFQSQADNPNAFAPAVFIGEDQLGPIPAFCGGSQGNVDPCTEESAPQNWVYAQTTWDTGTVAADTDWKFWVVVWMENGGQKVAEIQDHGLTGIPGNSPNSLADVPIEPYSNNLGFYNQTFHVASPTSQAQPKGTGTLVIDRVAVPAGPVLLHQPVTIRASHRSSGPRFDSVLTLFYDGDPEQGGVLFDQEVIPRIRANNTFVAPVPYRPGTCGTHRIFVQAIPTDGSAEPATGTATVQVTADFPAELASLAQAIQAADLPRGIEQSLLARVKTAQKFLQRGQDRTAQNQLAALKHEIEALRGKKIPEETAAAWVEEVELMVGCINPNG